MELLLLGDGASVGGEEIADGETAGEPVNEGGGEGRMVTVGDGVGIVDGVDLDGDGAAAGGVTTGETAGDCVGDWAILRPTNSATTIAKR